MYEFYIENLKTKKLNIIFGYFYEDALNRNNLKSDEWICKIITYID